MLSILFCDISRATHANTACLLLGSIYIINIIIILHKMHKIIIVHIHMNAWLLACVFEKCTSFSTQKLETSVKDLHGFSLTKLTVIGFLFLRIIFFQVNGTSRIKKDIKQISSSIVIC